MRKLTVVIVSYNVKYYLGQCLDSLAKALGDTDSEVVVVDNHSHDGTVAYIKENYPKVKMIASDHNWGFARANNIAIRESESEYVLLLNPDTVVAEDTIKGVLRFMDEHENAGGVGVRMYNPNGTTAPESRRGIPTPMTSFYKFSGLTARYPRSRRFGHYYMGYLSWEDPAKIEIVSGAFCMLRRAALDKVGLLDEDFFMYGEDIDLSYRILKGGYENWYLPLPILHYKGESTQKSSFRYVHIFYNAMFIFLRKHYSGISWALSIPIKAAIVSLAAIAFMKMQLRQIRKSLGFKRRRKMDVSPCICIGKAAMIDGCRQLARQYDFTAVYKHVDNGNFNKEELTALKGELNSIKSCDDVNIVFDTAAFSYKEMMEIMAFSNDTRCVVATYDTRTKTIITPNDIIR